MLRVVATSAEDVRRRSPLHIPGSVPLDPLSGFHAEEREEGEPFRWMQERARLGVPEGVDRDGVGRYVEITVGSDFRDLSQELVARAGGEEHRFPLLPGWTALSFPLPAGAGHVDLGVDRPVPGELHPDDARLLTVKVRWPRTHPEAERHRHVSRQYGNALANAREMLAGATRLESTPPQLGIDLYGECNVKPACVYCAWDYNKDLEGENVDAPFTRETLEEWGDLFDNARRLVNCSIGEPFMLKQFDELLDVFGESGKFLEMSTNGQILTERNIERLLGRDIDLYVSLDAATPETYAKLRNEHFDRILVNLRRLIAAKGGRGGLPRVFLVFMPMKVNVHELEAFVELAAELGVDKIVLRPLNPGEEGDLDHERGGHHFVYEEQLLPFETLVRVSGRAAELARRHGVPLSDQLDFGGSMEEQFGDEFAAGRSEAREEPAPAGGAGVAEVGGEPAASAGPTAVAGSTTGTPAMEAEAADGDPPTLGGEKLPACTEPWKSLYILRRGVMPCCYGAQPIAPADGYRQAWNGPLLRRIRRELARGRFHRYCYDSPACPIVRKAEHAGRPPWRRRAFLAVRSAWCAVNDATGGGPRKLYRPLKRAWRRLRGEPV